MFSRSTAGALVLALLTISSVFGASDYTSTLWWQGELIGATRPYTGTSMNIAYDTYIGVNGTAGATKYSIYLDRHSCFFFICTNTSLGSVTAPYVGHAFGQWSGVGGGDYFFTFVKARDGITLASDNVHMYSR
jgi:hypothetical protein